MGITKQIEINLTPQEVAQAFCEMTGSERGRFFNAIGGNVKGWAAPFSVQMMAMIDADKLNKEGREAMRKIGDYANETSFLPSDQHIDLIVAAPDTAAERDALQVANDLAEIELDKLATENARLITISAETAAECDRLKVKNAQNAELTRAYADELMNVQGLLAHVIDERDILKEEKELFEEENAELVEAVKGISEGRGRFSRDPLKHAENTIEDMKKIAREALARHDREWPFGQEQQQKAQFADPHNQHPFNIRPDDF